LKATVDPLMPAAASDRPSVRRLVRRLVVRLRGHRPAEASPLGWCCFQLGLLLLASSAFLAGAVAVLRWPMGPTGCCWLPPS
jgi:hypothetical protein